MEARVDAGERPLDQREARTLPMAAGVALGFGGCLTTAMALLVAVILPVVLREGGAIRVMLGLPLAGLAAGFLLVGYGARGLFRRAQARKRAALHPGEPWYADWDWDPEGVAATGRGGGDLLGFILLGVPCGMMSFLFLTEAVPSTNLSLVVKALLALVVGTLDFLLVREMYRTVKEIAVSRGRLHFDAFPFLLGRPLKGRLVAKDLAGRDEVVVTLRCLEERYVTHRTRNSTRGQLSVGVFQLYEASRTAEGGLDGDAGASVSLPLPDADLGTRLSGTSKDGGDLPRYWELEVEAKGADPLRFLVPVYRAAN
jgi:hypothetical protein